MSTNTPDIVDAPSSKKAERNVFLFLVVLFAPIVSIALVGGFGFIIWMLQIIFGPPTG